MTSTDYRNKCEYIKSKVRTVPDWPIDGVMFRDITTILSDTEAFRETCNIFYERYANENIDKIVGIDNVKLG